MKFTCSHQQERGSQINQRVWNLFQKPPFRIQNVWRLRHLAGAFLLIGWLLPAGAQAQFGVPMLVPGVKPDVDTELLDHTRRLPRDPLTQASAANALNAIESGDVTAGLQTIQELIDEDSDFFVMSDSEEWTSLFQQLELLIRENRDDYERLFGPQASQMLSEAVQLQDVLRLEEIVRRFGLTDAGAEALRHLARIHQDHGEPARAARALESLSAHPAVENSQEILARAARLLAAHGQSDQARRLVARHADEFSEPFSSDLLKTAAASSIPSAADAQIFEWRIPYGDARHTGRTAPAPAMFDDAWSASLIDEIHDFPTLQIAPEVAARLAENNRRLLEAIETQVRSNKDRIAMPAVRPLIVNDLVITAGPGSVKAFNLRTGRLEWNGVDLDETFDYLNRQSYSAGDAHDPVREEMRELFTSVRGWRDLTSSSLSTDGHRVYAISNCQLVGTTSPQRMMQNTQRHSLLPQRFNRLTAYELAADGKKLWAIGTGSDEAPLANMVEDREIYFLGAPLPVDGRLYVLGEERGQIQIFEIDPATGAILWSLGLLNPDRDLILDDVRRLAGLMPAYADGLLICPTGEGSLTAVDPLRRQVVWTHFYSELVQPQRNRLLLQRMMRPQNKSAIQARDELLNDQRWFDPRILIAGDRVLFTPPDDDHLICLDLHNGEPLWDQPVERGQNIYAGAVYQDQIILVGRSEITSLSLVDASPVWKSPVPIPGPSGRGIRMDDQFLQPLQSGEIAVVDLRSGGRLMTRLPMSSGAIPGNLVAHDGVLVSQSATGLTGFRSRSELEQKIAERLAENANDAQALAWRGEWELQQGELEQGLADLKKSLASTKSSTAQLVLAWSLLDGLRTDFAAYRNQVHEIESALDGPELRLQFLRTYARGLQQAGEIEPAFQQYLSILGILKWPVHLHDFDSRWSAADSRWVLARLDELLASADEPTRKRLLNQLNQWVATTESPLLIRLLPAFPQEWLDGRTVIERFARTETGMELLHAREGVLENLLSSSKDPQIQAAAATLLLRQALQVQDAVMTLRMLSVLEREDVDLITDPGLTSFELARQMRQDPDVADLIHSEVEWLEPVHVSDRSHGSARTSTFQIPLLGPPSLALEGWTFFLDQGGVNIEIFDRNGRHYSRVPTSYPGVRYAVESDLGRYVCMHNHLVMVVLLDRFLILDMQSDSGSPRVLARREFEDQNNYYFPNRGPLPGRPRPGLRSPLLELRGGTLASNVGPLNDSVVCYCSGDELIAIDPLTDRDLWRRRDLPEGAEILADERYVMLKPVDSDEFQVFSSMDGSLVGSRSLPDGALNCLQRRNGDWQRGIPVVVTADQSTTWTLYDPVTESPFWSATFPQGTRTAIVNGQKVAFLTPENRLSIHDGMTGETVFAADVPVETSAAQMTVLEFADQWIVLMSSRPADDAPSTYGFRLPDRLMADVDGTVVALDRASGEVLWKGQMVNQEVLTQAPGRWPLLLFGKRRGGLESVILNRHTGEILRKQIGADDGSGISWIVESQPLRAHLKFAQDRVTLLFGGNQREGRVPTAPLQSEDAPQEDDE